MTMTANDKKQQRIGVYGGTFAPPHFGHIRAARAFLTQLELDAEYIVPTSIPPHKRVSGGDEPNDRLEMTRLAFSGEADYGARLFVSDHEVRSPGKSYTVLTLGYFKEQTSAELVFLCGADMFVTLESWYRAEEIFKLASIAYVSRDGTPGLEQKAEYYREKYGAQCIPVAMEPLETSSSEIRRRIASGEDVAGLLPEPVIAYIRRKNLYQGGKT